MDRFNDFIEPLDGLGPSELMRLSKPRMRSSFVPVVGSRIFLLLTDVK